MTKYLNIENYKIMFTTPFFDKRLSNGAKVTYAILSTLSQGTAQVEVTTRLLSLDLGESKKSARRYLKELKDTGYILVDLVRAENSKRILRQKVSLIEDRLEI